MFNLIGKFFTGRDSSDDSFDAMRRRLAENEQRFSLIGAHMADGLLHDGLRKGKFIPLSSVRRIIAKDNPSHSQVVEHGFMTRMLEHVRNNEVVSLSVESSEDDVVFVHSEHLPAFEKMLSEKRAISR